LSIAAQSKQQTLIKQVVSIFLFNLSDYHLIRGASGTTAINHKKLTSIKKKKTANCRKIAALRTATNYKTYLNNPVYNLRPLLESEIAARAPWWHSTVQGSRAKTFAFSLLNLL
jgi:hypothetical protein